MNKYKRQGHSRSELLYFRDISRYQLIPAPREKVLIEAIKEGDRKSLNELLTGNLRFVASVARKYLNKGLSLLELINEGNLGLYKAAKKFSSDKDVRFISYAVWWIRQSIQKALMDQSNAIKIPPNKLILYKKFKQELDKNNGDYEKTFSIPEFRDMKDEILSLIGEMNDVSLDVPVQSEESDAESINTLIDTIGVAPSQEEESERQELREVVDSILSVMPDKEQTVLRMYYGIGYLKEYTLDEIGRELNLTKERVRQIKNRALRKLLRNKKSKESLTPFFPQSESADLPPLNTLK